MAHPLRSFVLLCALLTVPMGCNVLGVITDKFAGDLPVEPEYKPDPLRPMLIIAENYRDPTNPSDAMRLQEIVGDRLAVNNVAPIISNDRLLAVRDRSPMAYRKMSVVEIARSVGAEQVLYIDLTSVGVGTQVGGDSLKGVASARVKLIDVGSGTVIYPPDIATGASVSFESEMQRESADMTADRVRGETLVGLGTNIARLFHSYRRSDMERMKTY